MKRRKFKVVYLDGKNDSWSGFYIHRYSDCVYLYDHEIPESEVPCLEDAYLVINLNNLVGYCVEDYDRKPGEVIPTPIKPGSWIKVNENPRPMEDTFWGLWKGNGRYPK